MDCPRCDAGLDCYAFEGREAVICEACGYAGVAAEHGSTPTDVEFWDAALERFRERD